MWGEDWAFADARNVATITSRKILSGEHFLNYVSHDEDDGSWQFLHVTDQPFSFDDAALVALSTIIAVDDTLNQIADLPFGWCATRDVKGAVWVREKYKD